MLALGPFAMAPAQSNQALVYRDAQGVPHITAETEETAWYALGYEQARDGLLWIQYACKAARGELTWVRGDETGLFSDMTVKVLGGRLSGLSTAELRALLAPANQSGSTIPANFYDNCVAFAAGANAYRDLVKNATSTPNSREGQLRAWLSASENRFPFGQPSLAWVYNDAIDPVDIASQGGVTAAFWNFLGWELDLVNSPGDGFTDADGDAADQAGMGGAAAVDPELVGDPLNPISTMRQIEKMREYAAGGGSMAVAMAGSNSFAWSGL